jgi:molybdenum cofactor cytidylyltransferase
MNGAGIGAILLAAGESRRMGYPKPLLKIGDETFITHIAAEILQVIPRLVIVLGAHADRVRPAIPRDSRIVVLDNPAYARGQLSSLKVGLRFAIAEHARAVVVHLADHPRVAAETFRALVDAHDHLSQPIVIARYCGRRGHPALFSAEVFDELLNAPEDRGARVVVNADPARVAYLDVDDAGVVLDLDTPDDLVRAGLKPDS